MNESFDRRLKVHPNGTLSVQAVTEKDAGDYLCIARNKVADDYRLLRVTVAAKPATIEPKQLLTQMVSVGKPLKVSRKTEMSLNCNSQPLLMQSLFDKCTQAINILFPVCVSHSILFESGLLLSYSVCTAYFP